MNYPHGRPEYLNEVCVNCGGERGLHNHMNQACPKDPNANRDHTEYRTTTFAAAQPSKVQENDIDWKEKYESLVAIRTNIVQERNEAKKEIERLKGLMKEEFFKNLSHLLRTDKAMNNLWYEFSNKNNL